ncbi:MAG: sodium:proton antiporter [Ignavibacteria bacterium RIFOXYC2_FULL_35_21]|nr:MAG: sodium:proton antiporter [Ignavibacteria bacterium RIFOXYA2_FULL_35_10]OGV23641.1 MAG: sodium:proton antiporter [Ignavibacteria bacterium RIFOXYC2_FULL_35_21]
MKEIIPLWSMLPFILMLGSIAVFPVIAERFWKKNRNKFIMALVLGIPTAIWLLANSLGSELYHSMVFDYIPFIILLGALFVITGGIFVDGDIEAKPIANTAFLAIGAVLASFMGTTGAAMLLIRPLIHTNKRRELKTHTILFFIGIVANCGGLLTPLGDPPLFMMYLRGAPFTWFLHLVPEWLFVNILLLIIYFFVDTYFWKKETPEAKRREHEYKKPIKLEGKLNFIWLLGVILAVALINPHTIPALGTNPYLSFIRETVIVLMAILSLQFTTHMTRTSNSFSWHPIEEVAYLFLGIFITMVPCLLYLESNAESLGITTHTLFYYATGGLSGFLDNTPTAVTFYSLAKGLVEQEPFLLQNVPVVAGIPEVFMKAISVSSVFFGSMTYIGNGPNFMVKSIAEHSNIKMPHFFAYMYKFSLIILLPLFILCQLLFL